jgi:glycosyltransferase involved in cell wall biosynthesis
MIENHDIICFSNDWDGDPLSKKHIMRRLAGRNRILWVNSIGNRNPGATARDLKRAFGKLRAAMHGFRQVEENIWVLSPLAIPFHGMAAARMVNRRLLSATIRVAARRLGFRDPLTWTFVPSSADVAGTLGERSIIYHCVDEFSQFSGTDRAAILEMERRLMEKADAVVVSASRLLEAKRRYNPYTCLVTHGVDIEHFRGALDPETLVPPDIASLRPPVIGFFGLIADWVDLALIRRLAERRPAWSFALIGKVDCDDSAVRRLPNVHLLGRKQYAELPAYCKAFDVALLPFVINELTLNANPLKLREYLAAGLPVVTSASPEAQRLGNLVRVAHTPEQWLEQIECVLAGRTGPQAGISRAMDGESWEAKVEELSAIVLEMEARQAARTASLQAA